MRFQAEPSVEPPTYGAEPGHRVTASGHATLTAVIATPASSNWRMRTASRGGPASRYAAPSAGTTIQPCSIFVMNARPTTTPAHTSVRVRPDWIARTTRYADSTSSNTSSASGLFTRPIAIDTGEIASVPAASSAGP